MKRIISTLLISVLLLSALLALGSCQKEYTGKEIASIEYSTFGAFGDSENRAMDLKTGEINVTNMPAEYDGEPKLESYGFDVAITAELVNKLYSAGLFDLDEEYEADGVILDGGRWILTITYADGTTKSSKGVNSGPYDVFERANLEFFYLTGKDFFSTVSDIYKIPPSLQIAYTGDNISQETTLSPYKYTWYHSSTEEYDFVTAGLLRSPYNLKEGLSYGAKVRVLDESKYNGLPKSTYKYTEARVVSYDLNGGDRREISVSEKNRDIQFDLELNRIYVITVEYEGGSGEYAFSTQID